MDQIIFEIIHYIYFFLFLIFFLMIFKTKWDVEISKVFEYIFHMILASFLGYSLKMFPNNIFHELFSSYWKLYVLLFLVVVILFIRDIIQYNNLKPLLINLCKHLYIINIILLIVSIYNSYEKFWISIIITILGFLWLAINYNKRIEPQTKNDEKLDIPINDYEELFPTRQKELNRILLQISKTNTIDNFAIAINGPWGVGKTSFVNVLKSELEKNNEIIFIQPMILDTREKLLSYVFNQLETTLNKNGIYTGKGSTYKNYFDLILKFVNFKGITNLTNIFNLFSEEVNTDLRETKLELEKTLSILVKNNKKIYIIIDDLDRVEETTIYDILTFIKEIIDLKGLSVLFIVDYNKIISEKITKEYLEKFIYTKFDLINVDSYELFSHYFKVILNESDYNSLLIQKEIKKLKSRFQSYITNFSGSINDSILQINRDLKLSRENTQDSNDINKIIKELETNKENLEINLNKYRNSLSNARYVKKIVLSIKETFDYLSSNLNQNNLDISTDNGNIEKDYLIFKLSLFRIIFKNQYDKMLEYNNIIDFIKLPHQDKFVKEYFPEGKDTYFESTHILNSRKITFLNTIIYSEDLSSDLFIAIKGEHETNLELLDSTQVSEDNHFNEVIIKDYFNAINYKKETMKKDILIDRICKFSQIVMHSIKNNDITIFNALELLSDPYRNFLLEHPIFFQELDSLVYDNLYEYNNLDQKNRINYIIKELERPLVYKLRNHILMLLWIYNIHNGQSYEETKNSFKETMNLESFNKYLTNTLKLELPDNETDFDSVNYTKKLFRELQYRISQMSFETDEVYNSYNYNSNAIEEFITIFNLVERINSRFSNFSITDSSKFNLNSDTLSDNEIPLRIDELYEYTKSKKIITYEHFRFFQVLLNNICIPNRKISENDLNKLYSIKSNLTVILADDSTIFSEDTWYYCLVRLYELKQNHIK
jgi:DNA polymerase III delta prime subunit